jgi:2-oxoglutarate ferredoxin oxidoreductase subunit beta
VARVAVNNIKNLKKAKAALKKAVEYQIQGKGFAFVEFLSACPTNWKMSALDANQRVGNEMADYFPLGVFKDAAAGDQE